MPKSLIDKSATFLILIVGAVAVSAAVLLAALRVEPIQQAVDDNRVINMALILEKNGKPITTELMLYYTGNARGALLDIPAETGLIIKSLNRVDRIDVLYEPADPSRYLDEISRLTGAAIDWYMVLDMDGLSDVVDILEGCTVFVPNRVETAGDDERPDYLPSGSVLLDGAKMALYASYQDPDRPEAETVARRQSVFQSLLRSLGERSAYVLGDGVFPAVDAAFRTNLKPESRRRLFAEFSRLDVDKLVLQRMTGTYRQVEGMQLLFPHYDGELVRDIVKQTLNALLNAESIAIADKVFTLEILNGTSTRGLAQKTAEIFASFGYEVVSVGNTPQPDVESTRIVDRYGDTDAAQTVAAVIRCDVVETGAGALAAGSPADFIIVLGGDFNGRYCVDR